MFLGKTGLVVRWLLRKQPFLPFLTQHWPTVWPQKAQIRNSLKSILIRKNRYYIIINFVTLRLAKVIFLKIIRFLPFLTQIGQNFGPKCPSNVAFLAIFDLNFHSSICTNTTFCFKRYSPCKMWKNLLIMPVSLLFSQHWTWFGPNFALRPHPLWFILLVSY